MIPGNAQMDFGPHNELEGQDLYMPCNAVIVQDTCIAYAIYPYYEVQFEAPPGQYILSLEYEIYHPRIRAVYEGVDTALGRGISFLANNIPKAIKKKVQEISLK